MILLQSEGDGDNVGSKSPLTCMNPFLRVGGGPHSFGGVTVRPKHWGSIILHTSNSKEARRLEPAHQQLLLDHLWRF